MFMFQTNLNLIITVFSMRRRKIIVMQHLYMDHLKNYLSAIGDNPKYIPMLYRYKIIFSIQFFVTYHISMNIVIYVVAVNRYLMNYC